MVRYFSITFAAAVLASIESTSSRAAAQQSQEASSCLGKMETDTVLDFFNSVEISNEMDLGGELRYGNIGKVRGNYVDLVVTATDYHTGYGNTIQALNGKFGQIPLNTVQGQLKSGRGIFEFCLVEPTTTNKVIADSFQWTIYDFDNRGLNAKRRGIKEKMFIDTNQASDYILYPDSSTSEVKQSCEDGSTALPCAEGVRTLFEASTGGTKWDNPDDPDALTEQQMSRSIVFTFRDTSCWTFEYDAYCPYELETPKRKCTWYGGSNFFFAGKNERISAGGQCIVTPTTSPTATPTQSPTTLVPSTSPTATPTQSPTTLVPSTTPTATPTQSPTTLVPSTSPTATPSATPTATPTRYGIGEYRPLPSCPDDVKLSTMHGATVFPEGGGSSTDPAAAAPAAVRIVSRDVSTVTVDLMQAWNTSNVEHYFYEYAKSTFDNKCYEKEDVKERGTLIDTITIRCRETAPYARLAICLQDTTGELLGANDNAKISQCCHPDAPEGTPTVCYVLEVKCVDTCTTTSNGGFADAAGLTQTRYLRSSKNNDHQ